ncbi:hypothetical protein K1719_022348 [Acacia pycnantha]|nr:hypothetical protein K1719_022348 [Acacia pycnantha]
MRFWLLTKCGCVAVSVSTSACVGGSVSTSTCVAGFIGDCSVSTSPFSKFVSPFCFFCDCSPPDSFSLERGSVFPPFVRTEHLWRN